MHGEPSHIDTTGQPRTPEDYRKAIANLETSTLAIESHITTTQQILDTIAAKHNNQARPSTTDKHQALFAQISAQHTSLTQYLASTSSDLQKAISSTLITIDDTLSRDDYTFDQIARSLSALNSGGPVSNHGGIDDNDDDDDEENDSTSKTLRLLDALHRTETEAIRTRLERIYLETLNSTSHPSTSNGTHTSLSNYDHDYADPTKLSAIHSDLRTLYAEIEDVTSLFVAHEHGDSLNLLNDEINRARRVLAQQRGEWAVSKMREMRGRLIGIEEGVRGVQGQRVVVGRLKELLGAVDREGEVVCGANRDVEGNAVVGGGKREGDGSALVGLRGYLGVGGMGGTSQGSRIDESFKEVKQSVEKILEVQRSQSGMIKKNAETSKKDTSQHDGVDIEGDAEISRDKYTIMLHGLDAEIAEVKEGIEKLPSG